MVDDYVSCVECNSHREAFQRQIDDKHEDISDLKHDIRTLSAKVDQIKWYLLGLVIALLVAAFGLRI